MMFMLLSTGGRVPEPDGLVLGGGRHCLPVSYNEAMTITDNYPMEGARLYGSSLEFLLADRYGSGDPSYSYWRIGTGKAPVRVTWELRDWGHVSQGQVVASWLARDNMGPRTPA
ncbi:predicted protein [Aspergillus nidulans FGSC A4]|uniref:Uncharacterized protein n=1 Tax=Emericella nidulans (strain FGSC A4 / ATCC 38163 / CBS 112.46 / NRRL 194 / M139) TaxID=227321 RepID=Q5B811_EMENI|nr:hypothetical protein [Aspergillus nidulans FGSC A4]EAA63287.1 predicted protein [Aspergillus nidulans FGSC A4]CBF82963.1 TPA: hypothetical protein ANIA_03319 [Aspergillus nidulans FGSC A4]|eukprot:XP_660923.1 predicted protein [Aspergillus nidulans FGSC A4]